MEVEISGEARTFLQWEDTVPGAHTFTSEKRVFVKTATGEHTVPGADTFCLSKLQWENTVPGHTCSILQYLNFDPFMNISEHDPDYWAKDEALRLALVAAGEEFDYVVQNGRVLLLHKVQRILWSSLIVRNTWI